MGGGKSKAHVSTSSEATTTSSPAASQPRQRIVQNYVLVWVDAGIDQSNKDNQNTLAQLRSVVNDVTICTQSDQCIQFLNSIDDEKAFVIISGSLGQHLVPDIHAMPQLDAIYIFCRDKSRHEQWAQNWTKIKGVHTAIAPLCEALELAAKQCNEDSITISVVPMDKDTSGENLEKLEASFMYSQIFAEILLEMEFDEQSIKKLSVYCRTFYTDNGKELNVINEFAHKYSPESSIWWYTRECFTYQMLNRALRNLEADTIIKMGFFIRDLHRQIEQLHQKQISGYHGKTFIIYRGQGLSTTDFEKFRNNKGGLMSFNNFLSTSIERQISLRFAKNASRKTDMVGVLFQMFVDPSVSSAPFAAIREVSCYKKEEEILFSLHTVFRIREIKEIDSDSPLYQVNLQLTSDDDPQLRTLTERIRQETSSSTGGQRLGKLLIKIGKFEEAENLYQTLLDQTTSEDDKAHYYNQLGYVTNYRHHYERAILYYEKALEIYHKSPSSNQSNLAASYNNIGEVYHKMTKYSKALSTHEKALEIYQNTLPPNYPLLGTSYSNIAGVYYSKGEYLEALSFYEKALEIKQKTLPPNHPSLATSYNNIGMLYYKIGEHSKTLLNFERALEISERSLPPDHPDVKNTRDNIENVKKKLQASF